MAHPIDRIYPKEAYRIAQLITRTGKPHVCKLLFGISSDSLWTKITFESHWSVEDKRKILLWNDASVTVLTLIKHHRDKIESDKYEEKMKSLSYQYAENKFISQYEKIMVEKSPWYTRIFK